MIIIEHILGNIKQDPLWQQRSQNSQIDILVLDQREAQKSRCRKHTQNGQDLGIALDRDQLLADGDVILFDATTQHMIVVQISLRDVMVINLQHLNAVSAQEQIRISFELGHALGNQHWKAVLKDQRVYVPLTVSEKVMESVMRTHGFAPDTFAFVKGEAILPELTRSQARLLFGGAEDTDTHIHVASSHEHSHHHEPSHQHDHDHDHDHTHKHQ